MLSEAVNEFKEQYVPILSAEFVRSDTGDDHWRFSLACRIESGVEASDQAAHFIQPPSHLNGWLESYFCGGVMAGVSGRIEYRTFSYSAGTKVARFVFRVYVNYDPPVTNSFTPLYTSSSITGLLAPSTVEGMQSSAQGSTMDHGFSYDDGVDESQTESIDPKQTQEGPRPWWDDVPARRRIRRK